MTPDDIAIPMCPTKGNSHLVNNKTEKKLWGGTYIASSITNIIITTTTTIIITTTITINIMIIIIMTITGATLTQISAYNYYKQKSSCTQNCGSDAYSARVKQDSVDSCFWNASFVSIFFSLLCISEFLYANFLSTCVHCTHLLKI